jgi:hypothetical protein
MKKGAGAQSHPPLCCGGWDRDYWRENAAANPELLNAL